MKLDTCECMPVSCFELIDISGVLYVSTKSLYYHIDILPYSMLHQFS